jgi:hypothetical protein
MYQGLSYKLYLHLTEGERMALAAESTSWERASFFWDSSSDNVNSGEDEKLHSPELKTVLLSSLV